MQIKMVYINTIPPLLAIKNTILKVTFQFLKYVQDIKANWSNFTLKWKIKVEGIQDDNGVSRRYTQDLIGIRSKTQNYQPVAKIQNSQLKSSWIEGL